MSSFAEDMQGISIGSVFFPGGRFFLVALASVQRVQALLGTRQLRSALSAPHQGGDSAVLEFTGWSFEDPEKIQPVFSSSIVDSSFIVPMSFILDGYAVYPLLVIDEPGKEQTVLTVRHQPTHFMEFPHISQIRQRWQDSMARMRNEMTVAHREKFPLEVPETPEIL